MDRSMDQDSLMEAIDDENEVFFGALTEKEKKICAEFRDRLAACTLISTDLNNKNSHLNKCDGSSGECNNSDESVYKSFSVDGSQYESFIDSIDGEVHENQNGEVLENKNGEVLENQNAFLSSFLPDQQADNVKKSVNLRPRGGTLYDSLEDICSLVSNVEKLSISDENVIKVPEKQLIDEDSVNPCVVGNKFDNVTEPMHFDDDSLAIAELEKTFDDSLEEVLLPACIEVLCTEDKGEIISPAEKTKVISTSADNLKHSVQCFLDKKSFSDSIEERKEIFSEKNFKDSLSTSELNDILKDSLAEKDECFALVSETNIIKSPLTNYCDKKSKKSFFSENLLDASVQIVFENMKASPASKELDQNTNTKYESLSSSDCISKDSLDEPAVKSNCEFLNKTVDTEQMLFEQEKVKPIINEEPDVSVLILYENLKSSNNPENVPWNFNSVLDCNAANLTDIKLEPDVEKYENNSKISSDVTKNQKSIFNAVNATEQHSVVNKAEVQNKVHCSTTLIPKEKCKESNSNVHIQPTLDDGKGSSDFQNLEKNKTLEKNKQSKLKLAVKSKVHKSKLRKAGSVSPESRHFSSNNKISNALKQYDLCFETDKSSENPLLQALDLHDTSINFNSKSFLESRDSLMPLNLCVRDTSFYQKNKASRNESKENIPEVFKTPHSFNKLSRNIPKTLLVDSPKETKAAAVPKTTKIPVRKIDNAKNFFKTPKSAEIRKKVANSGEKQKSPLSAKVISRTVAAFSDVTPKKAPHFCILPSSISKLPKSATHLTAKKFQNVQSPVGQYMRKPAPNAFVKVATPVSRPLRCMLNTAPECHDKEVSSHVTVRKVTPQKQRKNKDVKI